MTAARSLRCGTSICRSRRANASPSSARAGAARAARATCCAASTSPPPEPRCGGGVNLWGGSASAPGGAGGGGGGRLAPKGGGARRRPLNSGLVFENFTLPPPLGAGETVGWALLGRGFSKNRRYTRAAVVLDRV